jgi:hypothetical protein
MSYGTSSLKVKTASTTVDSKRKKSVEGSVLYLFMNDQSLNITRFQFLFRFTSEPSNSINTRYVYLLYIRKHQTEFRTEFDA